MQHIVHNMQLQHTEIKRWIAGFAVLSASAKHRRPSLEGSPPPGVLAEGEAGGEPGGLRTSENFFFRQGLLM